MQSFIYTAVISRTIDKLALIVSQIYMKTQERKHMLIKNSIERKEVG
jgi:hypothetical protein